MNRIKKWIDKLLGKVYYLPKEYRTHLPPEKSDESTTVDPIYEKQIKKERNVSRKFKKTLSSSWSS